MENGERIKGMEIEEQTAPFPQENMDALKKGVEAVAYGFVFLCLNLNVGRLSIFPEWVGYLLFREAIDGLGTYEPDVLLLKPLALVLAAYDAACWLAKLFGFSRTFMAVEVVFTIVALYFNYQFMTNLGNLAVRLGAPWGTWFYWLRILQAATTTAVMLFGVGVLERGDTAAAWFVGILIVSSMVMSICTLLAVHELHVTVKGLSQAEG